MYDECLIHVVENVPVTWPSISSDAGNYYSSIDFTLEPSKLLTALNSLNRRMKNPCSYKNATEVLKYAEEDPEKPGNVILIYTSESRKYDKSTVNKEHVWPQSRGLSGEAYADPHMLHLADSKENGARGNDIYGEKQIPNVIMSKWMSGKVLVLDQLCMSMLHINIWDLY